MNKTLKVIGGIFAVVVFVILGAFAYMVHAGPGLDQSSKAYVDASVPAIVSAWSKDELVRRASPQLTQILNQQPKQLDQLFGQLSKLGSLKQYQGSKGESSINLDLTKGKTVTAQYLAGAVFERGDTRITVHLIQIDDQWRIRSFNVKVVRFFEAQSAQPIPETKTAAAQTGPEKSSATAPAAQPIAAASAAQTRVAATEPTPTAPLAPPATKKASKRVAARSAVAEPQQESPRETETVASSPEVAAIPCAYKAVMTDAEIDRCRKAEPPGMPVRTVESQTQSSAPLVGAATIECVYKPVMSDAEIDRCRR